MLDARERNRRLRVLLELGPEYEGFTAGAVWGKTETWARHPALWHLIEGYAPVSDIAWIGCPRRCGSTSAPRGSSWAVPWSRSGRPRWGRTVPRPRSPG
jgi:hypothetical protein